MGRRYLSDLFDLDEFREEVNAGHVTKRYHPDDDLLCVLNYTDTVQYERAWNDVTRQCRGLIVRFFDNFGWDAEIVARPWPKFFNYGEPEAGTLALDQMVTISDKVDGSLGIMYPHPNGGWAISTRGSFVSEQAIEGTRILREKYPDFIPWCPVCTLLFEIVYPENRIVLDYGEQRDLVLLGGVDTEDGFTFSPDHHHHYWPGPHAAQYDSRLLADVLAAPDRANAEGFVVSFGPYGPRVKIKQQDYLRLHKLVTGLNERAVWEHLASGARLTDLLSSLPDEFHEWATTKAENLWDQHDEIQGRAHAAYDEALSVYLENEDRGEYARWVTDNYPGELVPHLFSLLDGKDISPAIWRSIKPKGEQPFRRIEEEAA